MPNYSLILDTKFKPFSYQEMLAPVQAATQAHQVLEEEYGAITAKAGEIASKANEQTDPLAYKMYRQYADDLEARADQLLRYGLNASSRSSMLDLKARFSKEILPIETAYKRREALADEQRKAYAANPTLRYQRYARNMSLDEFINNPSSDYGESFSGALLAQQAGAMAANLKTALTGVGKMKSNGLPFQYEKLIQYGFRPEDIQFAINNPKDPKAAPILNTIIDQVLTANGINRWASPELLNEARAFANMGLYNAIGQTQIKDYKDDFGARVAADAINRRATAAQQAQIEHERALKGKMWHFADSHLYGERDEKNSAIRARRGNYSRRGFTQRDGTVTVTGARTAKRGAQIYDYIYMARTAKTDADKLKYAQLAYRAAYGKEYSYPGIQKAKGKTVSELLVPHIIKFAENSTAGSFYHDLRKANVSRDDIIRGNWTSDNQDLIRTNYSTTMQTRVPVVESVTHNLNSTAGKEIFNTVAAALGNSNVTTMRINSRGEVVPGSETINLLKLNKGKTDADKVYVSRVSLIPTSPGKMAFTLSNGKVVVLDKTQIGDVFGESTAAGLMRASNMYVSGNTNESATGLHNMNALMGTATTLWDNPEAEGTGTVDFTWDYGDDLK